MREIQFGLVVIGSLDHGIDDVGLPTLRDLLAEEIPHVVCSLAWNAARHDGRSARGQLVEHAYVEITVERERQSAGNRRGGHYQYIRFGLIGFLHQPEPLQDAEAVLLIDDNEAEAIEFHFFFDQRVGADDQLCFAAIDETSIGALSVFVERAG